MDIQLNVEQLGQVFTPCFIVSDMIGLMKNNGSILEPASGDGAFALKLPQDRLVAIEYDNRFSSEYEYINMDFFDYEVECKFDTIIGNPPYVRFQDIEEKTKTKISKFDLFDGRSNLYLFFIYKSILHLNYRGELIFITPRDFLKATSSIKLNEFIYNQGTITHIMEMGDKKIFKDAVPNTVIWRFEKDNFSRKTSITKNFIYNKGQLLFTRNRYNINFNDVAFVKVGAVSGADKYFIHKEGIEFVCSYTQKTGKTKKMLYNSYHKDLEQYKDILLSRKIKHFDNSNWYQWGRKYYISEEKRIYVNNKTRNKRILFR